MSHPALRPARLLVALAAFFLVSPAALAAEPQIDPEAKKVLDEFGKFYAGLDDLKVTVKINLTIEQQGRKQTQEFEQKITAQRPNKLLYALDASQANAQITSDGKELFAYIEKLGKYAVEEAPPTFDALFQNPIVMGLIGFGNSGGAIVAMLSNDPAAKLLEAPQKVEYGGLVDLGDTKCHLIKATQEQFDWELWIDAGKQPLVRQFVPDLTKAFARAAEGGNRTFDNVKVTNVASFTDWEIDAKLKADAFAFTLPKDATGFDSLMEMFTGRPSEPEPHELLGKPAPPVVLELLDGGKLDLASYKGKKVVILDFWATWCGPCVQAMPIIEKVAAKYKDKGVELFAVNLQEGPDEIKPFLEEAKLDVSVALDRDGEVAQAYKAEAIPQTVLVGKDGTVQVVKIGLSGDLADSLSKDLEALIEGKDLAAETLAAAKKKADDKKAAAEAKDSDEDSQSDK